MPRTSKGSSKPSAANRFAVSQSENKDGKQLALADVTDIGELGSWLEEVISTGARVTLGLTSDRLTITVAFYVDGENHPWYIQSPDGWDAMILRTSVDRP